MTKPLNDIADLLLGQRLDLLALKQHQGNLKQLEKKWNHPGITTVKETVGIVIESYTAAVRIHARLNKMAIMTRNLMMNDPTKQTQTADSTQQTLTRGYNRS